MSPCVFLHALVSCCTNASDPRSGAPTQLRCHLVLIATPSLRLLQSRPSGPRNSDLCRFEDFPRSASPTHANGCHLALKNKCKGRIYHMLRIAASNTMGIIMSLPCSLCNPTPQTTNPEFQDCSALYQYSHLSQHTESHLVDYRRSSILEGGPRNRSFIRGVVMVFFFAAGDLRGIVLRWQ